MMISSTGRVCASTESMARCTSSRRLYVGIIAETPAEISVARMLRGFARKYLSNRLFSGLYASGALGLYHRLRNADSLTVVMFHRTLRPGDPRWATCDPDYTLDESLFVESLAFFARHYRVVSLDQVLRARREGTRLPPRALLITFDDGWLDNVDYALPALQRSGLPAVMFVAADAVGARQPFWQERTIAAWRAGRLAVDALADTVVAHGGERPARDGIAGLRELIAQIERMPTATRQSVVAAHASALDDGLQHMVDVADLHRLRAGRCRTGPARQEPCRDEARRRPRQ